jgi:hypothetical protein
VFADTAFSSERLNLSKSAFINSIRLMCFSMLIGGCGSAIGADDIASTANHLAATNVALTLTALPSNTTQPTATLQPSSTETLEPSPTPSETATATRRALTTWAPYGAPDAGAFETAKADKSAGNSPLLLENLSGERILFILISPQYQEYAFTDKLGLALPQGQYSYRAWIGDKGPFSGSFALTNPDKHVLRFYSDKVHFSTP